MFYISHTTELSTDDDNDGWTDSYDDDYGYFDFPLCFALLLAHAACVSGFALCQCILKMCCSCDKRLPSCCCHSTILCRWASHVIGQYASATPDNVAE